jgi:2-iminobutanoate/2-iminopropanoate deaminase
MNKEIKSELAPAAIGPYSQAIEHEGLIFVSGQLPIVTATGEFPSDDIKEQTRVSLMNIKTILTEAGLTFANIVKSTVLLVDIHDFGAMNDVYSMFFQSPFPARAAFQIASLPKGAKVEIEVVAAR